MKSYTEQIRTFGYELADEAFKKEKDPKWVASLDRFKITNSLSKIYDLDLRRVTDDLDDSIKTNLRKIKLRNN